MSTINLFGKIFKITFLFIVLGEIFSYFAYLYPVFSSISFFVILFLVLILSLSRLEYGLYVVLAELFIGSKGYLFQFETNGLIISLRIGLFLVVFAVWFFRLIKKREFCFQKSQFFFWYILLFAILGWGIINGFLQGNSFNNLFFDINGWFYFGLIFIFYEVIKGEDIIEKISQVLTASLLVQAIKIFFLIFFFSHEIMIALPTLYGWVRTTGVGEITQISPNFWRIFFQSQLYALIGLFIFISFLIFPNLPRYRAFFSRQDRQSRDRLQRIAVLAVLSLVGIFISFSRSFWLAGIVGFIFLYLLLFNFKFQGKEILRVSVFLFALFLVSLGLIFSNINFPLAKDGGQIYSGSLLASRATTLSEEAAISSRWNLLPGLIEKSIEHPLFGSGFGTTITYQSSDPRILAQDPQGWYTTFAFEWGYLDIWLKIGLLGLLIYLYLIFKIFKYGWHLLKESAGENFSLVAGLLLGLLVVVVTNGVSPYLNHPLGIGYLMLSGAIFEVLKK